MFRSISVSSHILVTVFIRTRQKYKSTF